MERYKTIANREQMSFSLLCFDDVIDENNPVRAIDAIVESMGIPTLGFKYSETASTGRKPYSPIDMFKLYTYSYFNGIRSSRKIERECSRNIELMWLINSLAPDFKTIADFRKDNKEAIRKAFSKFSMICDSLGLIGKEMVAVDGSKFRANNSSDQYCTLKKTAKKIEHYGEQAKKYLVLLDANDEQEKKNPPPSFNKKDLKQKLDGIQKRISELKELQAEIEENGDIALTDPDSKMMQVKNSGREVSHNVQMAVESKNHLVVAVDVTSEAVDKEQLHNIALKAKEELGVDQLQVVADKGYYSARQFKECAEDHIIPIVPKAIHNNAPDEAYSKDKFIYDEQQDGYICPEGQLLKRLKRRASSTREEEIFESVTICRDCLVKEKCTRAPYRHISERPFQRYADVVDQRTAKNKEVVRLRKCLAEHPFGTLKRAFGFGYFLTRRTENVRTEALLHFFIYNIKRVMNIMGTEKLRIAMQG